VEVRATTTEVKYQRVGLPIFGASGDCMCLVHALTRCDIILGEQSHLSSIKVYHVLSPSTRDEIICPSTDEIESRLVRTLCNLPKMPSREFGGELIGLTGS
jgi:hypothetical protein